MIVLNPASVSLLGRDLPGVESVTVSRRARKTVEEWTDLGPYCAYADVPEQRVTVTLRRTVTADEPWSPRPGESGTLRLRVGASQGAARGRVVTATVVVMAAEHEAGPPGGLRQRVEMLAVSPTGAADPVQEQEVTS